MATAAAILLGAGLSGLALYNSARARRALFPHGSGRFVGVAGVRLHLLEQGSGTPLILLHGNGSSAEDFKTSGMLDKAASRYRVLALTGPASAGARGREANGGRRPSKPISFMPPSRSLGPKDISFWAIPGARRWLQLVRRHPASVAGIVLASGYYYPPPRLGLALAALPALPVAGDVFCHTLLPLLVRLTSPLAIGKIFRPGIISAAFASSAKDIASRPSQLRSIAAESGLMLAAALAGGRFNPLR